jgi:hypothetical protein
VELFAVLETPRTPREVDGALKAASGAGRACLVVCVVDEDPDARKAFGKAQRLMVGRAGWTMWIDRTGPGGAAPSGAPAAPPAAPDARPPSDPSRAGLGVPCRAAAAAAAAAAAGAVNADPVF